MCLNCDPQSRGSKAIDNNLRKARFEIDNEITLLLLGTGESGKSTVAKQMRMLYTGGFTHDERMAFRPLAYYNVIMCMKALLEAAEKLGIEVSEANKSDSTHFLKKYHEVDFNDELNTKLADLITKLWKDPGVQDAYSRRSQFQLMDSAEYVFENVHKFAQDDWVPDEQDILRVRARTTGVAEIHFAYKDARFRMIDVGGQRTERKKWIHYFQDVTAIIYCVALNEYDMKLFEDERVNRMVESLELFEYIQNSRWFRNTSIIIFLNKKDLFEDKIQKVDLNVLFEDYKGGCDYNNALEYIKTKFLDPERESEKKMFLHVTNATDTQNIRVVFEAAQEIIITSNLNRLGFGRL